MRDGGGGDSMDHYQQHRTGRGLSNNKTPWVDQSKHLLEVLTTNTWQAFNLADQTDDDNETETQIIIQPMDDDADVDEALGGKQ